MRCIEHAAGDSDGIEQALIMRPDGSVSIAASSENRITQMPQRLHEWCA